MLDHVKKGQPLTEELLNSWIDEINAARNFKVAGELGRNVVADANAILELYPEKIVSASGAKLTTPYPLEVYPSKYTGTGAPPADQNRRVKIRPSFISSGSIIIIPENIYLEQIVGTEDGYYVAYMDETHGTDGTLLSAVWAVVKLADLPTDPEGTLDFAPTRHVVPLTLIRMDGGTMTIEAGARGPLTTLAIPVRVECGRNKLAYFTPGAIPIAAVEED